MKARIHEEFGSLYGEALILPSSGSFSPIFFWMDIRTALCKFFQNKIEKPINPGKKIKDIQEKEGEGVIFVNLFTDKSGAGSWVSKSYHPLVLTLGNLTKEQQEKDESKVIVGWIPVLTDSYLEELDCSSIASLARTLCYHNCFKQFLSPVMEQSAEGFEFDVNGELRKFKVVINFLLGDLQDQYKAATKKGASWNLLEAPCITCQVPGNQLQTIEKEWPYRRKEEYEEVEKFVEKLQTSTSETNTTSLVTEWKRLDALDLVPIPNSFFKLPYFSMNLDFPPDRDHHYLGGLLQRVFINLKSLVENL